MAITYEGAIDLVSQSNQFIHQYGPGAFDIYDAETLVMASLPKTFRHQGDAFLKTINLSFGGGRGYGTLPTPSQWLSARITFARKKAYYRGRLDREALYASKGGGAVEELFKQVARIGPMSFRNMQECALFAPYTAPGTVVTGSGLLGTVTGVVNADPVFTLTIANDFKAANFEIGDLVHIETGNTELFEVQAITPGVPPSGTIQVERIAGVQVPAPTDQIFLQGSEDLAILGLDSVTDFVAGDSLYGVAHQYRYAPTRVNCAGALTIARMEEVVLGMGEMTGEGPDIIVMNREDWPTLTALMEGDKRYDVTMPKRDIKGHMGFKGLTFVHPYGVAQVHLSRYCTRKRMYFINSNRWELMHSQGFGWFQDSGSVFLTRPDDDELEVRYGGYMETFFHAPTYFGLLFNIA